MEVIPHEAQRYPTAGDWQWKDGDLYIKVSDTGIANYNVLLMQHEFVEALLCLKSGVSEDRVDAFDFAFELDPESEGEPGEDPLCPYRNQHFSAELHERLLAEQLKVTWQFYNAAVELLDENKAVIKEKPNVDETTH